MDAKRLAEIEARANAATPGPWYFRESRLCSGAESAQIIVAGEFADDACILQGSGQAGDYEPFIANAGGNKPFIAAARQDVPDLVARVRELEARLAVRAERVQELSERICKGLGVTPEADGMGIAADLSGYVGDLIRKEFGL